MGLAARANPDSSARHWAAFGTQEYSTALGHLTQLPCAVSGPGGGGVAPVSAAATNKHTNKQTNKQTHKQTHKTHQPARSCVPWPVAARARRVADGDWPLHR